MRASDASAEHEDPRALPDLAGRTYLITGANAGLGYFSSELLAAAGAHVIMSGRHPHRVAAAKAALLWRVPTASVETIMLDTSNLGSVRSAAATVRHRGALDGILLNAGVVHPPAEREETQDGHELVLATNVLGHFALAGEMLTSLAERARAVDAPTRLVWLGSMSTSLKKYDPVDPQLREGYSPWRAYVQSKVATTSIGLEADRRLRDAGVPVVSVIAHPGYATSGRTRGIQGVNEPTRATRFADNLQAPITQSKEHGARSLVHALAAADVRGGEMWGPRLVAKGAPHRARPARITRDPDVALRLWNVAEKATGVRWPFAAAAEA